MYYKKMLLWAITLVLIPLWMQAQIIEKSKHYDRSFKLQKTTEVNISNKYGNIHFVQWEKDSVRFVTEINIRSAKQARVDKLFNEIDIQFSQTPYYVNAISAFAGSGKLWTEISDVTKSVLSAGNEAEINYTVYLPSWAVVKVENRFGNIYTTDHPAESEFKLSNGSLQANALKGKTRITIAFGNAIIQQIDEGVVELNYAELELISADKLRLTGKASTIHIQEARHLNLNSRRDKIMIDRIESLSGETSFSRLELGQLQSDMLLQSSYGNLNLQEIHKDMQLLQLNASYTTIQLFLTKEQSAGVEIQFSKKARLTYPSALAVKEQQDAATESEISLLRGTIGSAKGSNLKFNLTGGELNIMQR